MGVPALFRWLSKKYPKIVIPVVEDSEQEIDTVEGGKEVVPVDTTKPNPNGVEFDNLYLDMNGIVHPCTHPEGKDAPATEGEMMVEIFNYTERVVNMVRPRKMLVMAIDGVAPRAKMNQQRSRRFRSAQEAMEKEELRKENIKEWEARGIKVTEEERNKKAWDSNAITPGTPFMDLLAQSLRYWVVKKMNTDPGWKNLEVILSDASVPGEGEHKIMDFIRRQRSSPGYDPNTQHVIYGLDADLIMLSLATHEPYFRVLREDVFFQDTKPNACRICKQEGHYAAQCKGIPKKKADELDTNSLAPVKKPFIFLDVSILREYLEPELNVPNLPFQFELERAIDDWVLLIFLVGNDFLPHLPSLEIREGAIDTLLTIWKAELPRMGGFLTNNGKLEYDRVQIILEGLAQREDGIFQRRREAEQRQDMNAKRRRIEMQGNGTESNAPSTPLTASITPGGTPTATQHGLPQKPSFNSFEGDANALGFGASAPSDDATTTAALAGMTGSAAEWVRNRGAIRMANMSAADMLRADMMSARPVKQKPQKKINHSSSKVAPQTPAPAPAAQTPEPTLVAQTPMHDPTPAPVMSAEIDVEMQGHIAPPEPASIDLEVKEEVIEVVKKEEIDMVKEEGNEVVKEESKEEKDEMNSEIDAIPGLRGCLLEEPATPVPDPEEAGDNIVVDGEDTTVNGSDESPHGVKRKVGEAELENEDAEGEEDEEETGDGVVNRSYKVNTDGTVEQEDTVKLWEPGYKDRYYKQKFGAEPDDREIRRKVTKSYVEGMAWVLHYYYQGTPSWKWFYPYHFAPFAADFEDVKKMDISFEIGQPFKPFEQLMGVFPAASKQHIPEVFHPLMEDSDSPIIDFYPTNFEIDMNGKKMVWQAVALLPFIDETRLLDAMGTKYPGLSEDEQKRNKWGANVVFVSDTHPLYPTLEALYGKRKSTEPMAINPSNNFGFSGSLLPDPSCIPYSTCYAPFSHGDLPDIHANHTLYAHYYFPKQLTPHRSVLLPGVRKPQRQLMPSDLDPTQRQYNGRGRPMGGGYSSYKGGHRGNTPPYTNSSSSFGGSYQNGYYSEQSMPRARPDQRRGGGPQRGSYPPSQQYNRQNYQGNAYGGNNNREPPSHYGGYGGGGYQNRESHSGYPPQQGNGYGGSGNRGGYGGDKRPPGRNSYEDGYGGGGYGGYGGGYGGNDGGGGYGGRGGDGYNSRGGGYGGPGRGGYNNPSRGGYGGGGQGYPPTTSYGGQGGYNAVPTRDPSLGTNYGGYGYGGGQNGGYGRGGGMPPSRGAAPSGQYGGRGYGRY